MMPSLPLAVLDEYLPHWASTTQFLGLSLWQWCELVVLSIVALVAGTILQALLVRVGRWVSHWTHTQWDERILAIVPGPTRILLALLVFNAVLHVLYLHPMALENVVVVVRTLLIATVTWLLLRLIAVAFDYLEARLTRDVDDTIRLRSIHAQLSLPRIILRVLAVLVGGSLILLQFEVVRSVGVSFLASAGVATIVIGLAAQRTMGNILAGLQLALTQPIKLGDGVLVEGEFGWIEEIGLTYIVVKIWDERRLILPVSSFLDKPFQNWTKTSTDMLGTVLVYVDYSVPVEEIRQELQRILRDTSLWDERTQGLQVTNFAETYVELRIVISARDSGRLWDLRCLIREKLLTWLQQREGAYLPVRRVQLDRKEREP